MGNDTSIERTSSMKIHESTLYRLIVKMSCHSMSRLYGLKRISSQTCSLLSITNIVTFFRPVAVRGSFVYKKHEFCTGKKIIW